MGGVVYFYFFPLTLDQVMNSYKFERDSCLCAPNSWSVNPKKVLGYRDGRNPSGEYMLLDVDRYEHIHYLPRLRVETSAKLCRCEN